MKFLQEGEWMVSTPFYAGTREAVDKMAKCPHPTWVEEAEEVRGGAEMKMDRCVCGATRGRYRMVKA